MPLPISQAYRDPNQNTWLLERDPNVTLQAVIAEAQRTINLQHDAAVLEDTKAHSSDFAVQQISRNKFPAIEHKETTQGKPLSACWRCSDWHFVSWCPFNKHICQKCRRRGHRDSLRISAIFQTGC
ncbi:unnamed protein product [Dicrocoelium dendriticum]|nr:unnamed protein product [Dicrocoelium dendriticum]